MIFLTEGEFIQGLKDYKRLQERLADERSRYNDLYYLRYGKVRSSLDYDVVGYKNGEAIRQIKGRGSYNPDAIYQTQEQLDREISDCLEIVSACYQKLEKVNAEIANIDEPLRTYLILRYRNGKTLKEVIKKCGLRMNEASMHKYIARELGKYYEK